MRNALGVVALGLIGTLARAESADSAKVYVGDEGVEVAVVRLRAGNQALVRVTGSGGELDGLVRLHAVEENGAHLEYRGRLRGRDFYTLVVRDGKTWLSLPKHRDSMALKYDEARTRALRPETVLAAYEQQKQAGTLEALERFDRKARVNDAEAELRKAAAAAAAACGKKVAVTVDWTGVTDEMLGRYSIPSYCGAPLSELGRLCETAEGKAYVAAEVNEVVCRFGPALALEVASGTLKWTSSTEGSNLDEFVRETLRGAPAPTGGPAFGQAQSLRQRLALEHTALCTDGKSHYVVMAPDDKAQWQIYYGDGKRFVAVPSPGAFLGGDWFFDPRHVAPGHNPNFRGYDMRVHSQVEADAKKGVCAVHCGERTTPLKFVDAEEKRTLLMGAKYEPTVQRYRPHVLLRDERGQYYYVDKGFRPGEEKRFRLWKGPKGSLKEQKMTNVVSDSEGEIFSTKTGSLRLIVDRAHPSVWIEGKRTVTLRAVPVEENLPLIYNELGVYLGEKMGTPCDDL
jgi:hypothetical protein